MAVRIKKTGFWVWAVAAMGLVSFSRLVLGQRWIGWLKLITHIPHKDDRHKGFTFLCTLPLKRPTVVWSKFAGSFVYILAGFGAVLVSDLAFKGFAPEAAYWQSILGYSLLPSGMLVLQGIFWLLFFKLGYIKAMNIFRFLLMTPLVTVAVASAIVAREMAANSSGRCGCCLYFHA
jgi:hypothetical protein